MGMSESIVIMDGARRTPRADILEGNQKPGLFSQLLFILLFRKMLIYIGFLQVMETKFPVLMILLKRNSQQ